MPVKKKSAIAKRGAAKSDGESLDFVGLVDSIRQVHEQCAAQGSRAVNVSQTLKNWVIGWYFREVEQRAVARAKYGGGSRREVRRCPGSRGIERSGTAHIVIVPTVLFRPPDDLADGVCQIIFPTAARADLAVTDHQIAGSSRHDDLRITRYWTGHLG